MDRTGLGGLGSYVVKFGQWLFAQPAQKQLKQTHQRPEFNDVITILFGNICLDLNSTKKCAYDVESLSNIVCLNKSMLQRGRQMLQHGYPCVLRLLLNRPDANYDPNQILKIGPFPRHRVLTHAVLGGHTNIVRELIQANAEVNFRDMFDNAPSFGGRYPMPFPQFFKAKLYLPPFLLAVMKGHLEIAKMLQKAGANIMQTDELVGSPLTVAFKMLLDTDGFGKVVEALLQMPGFDVNNDDAAGGITELMTAIGLAGHQEMLKEEYMHALRLLIQAGADIRAANCFRYTVLMDAVESSHPEIVQLLLDSLKSLNPSSSISSPAGVSGSSGDCVNPQLVKDALEACNGNNETALAMAVKLIKMHSLSMKRHRYQRIYDMLLRAQIDVEAQIRRQPPA